MKAILALIEQKKQEFAQLPLFEFMQDQSIDPRQRLIWAPCAAPFIMSFGELNKYVFREEPTEDPIQKMINRHTYEDARHWLWFLEDLQRLGLNKQMQFSDALQFLWSEETRAARWLTYQLSRLTWQATPMQKLVVVEVTEATGNVMFSVAAKVAQEITTITQKDYIYFGDFHLDVETGHTTGSPEIESMLAQLELTEENRQEAVALVEEVFGVFEQMMHQLLVYSQTHKIEPQLQTA